ncbi:hypothetical protein C1N83_00190 [Priestia aryabhattai]
MFVLPNIIIRKTNKQRYLHSLKELRNQLNTNHSYNINQNNSLELANKLPFCHQINHGSKNYDILKKTLESGHLYSASALEKKSIIASSYSIPLDTIFNRNKYLYFTLGRARTVKPRSSIYLLFNRISLENLLTDSTEIFFNDDINNFRENIAAGWDTEELPYLWNKYYDYILTIDDGIEIMGEFIASRYNELNEFFSSEIRHYDVPLFKSFLPEFVLTKSEIPITAISQIVHVYKDSLDSTYDAELKELSSNSSIPFSSIEIDDYYNFIKYSLYN